MAKMGLRIFGRGVRARLIVDLIHWQFSDEYLIEGFYDDQFNQKSLGLEGYPFLGPCSQGLADLADCRSAALIGFGTFYSTEACKLFLKLQSAGVQIPSIVSPSAFVSPSARIGSNTIVMPGDFIGCDASIGDLCCLHGGVVIEHHSTLGEDVFVCPGVTLSGFVKIKSHCFLGTGSKLLPEVTVGEGSLIGAGSLVLRDIPPFTVAYGHPAKVIRKVGEGMEVPTAEQIRSLINLGMVD